MSTVDITENGGILKTIIKEGFGIEKPTIGDEVHVHYNGYLLDGTQFDSSRDRKDPFAFKIGAGDVIKGWDKVVQSMRLGEFCKVTLRPEYGYGHTGVPPKIPPDSVLCFEMELISWSNEKDLTDAKDMGIMKKILKEGSNWDNPNFEATCKVHLKISDDHGFVYFNGNKDIKIGEEEITVALETVLTGMKKGETCQVRVKAKYGYGELGNKELGIAPNTDFIYQIQLLDFEKGKESWLVSNFDDKVELVNKRKNDGNKFFEEGKYGMCIKKYEKAIDIIKYDTTFTDQQKIISNSLKVTLYLNLAATFMKTEEYKRVVQNAVKVLEIDPKNVKGLWRKGCALMHLGDWNESHKTFEIALQIEPGNKTVKSSFATLNKTIHEADQKDKARYHHLFERLSNEMND